MARPYLQIRRLHWDKSPEGMWSILYLNRHTAIMKFEGRLNFPLVSPNPLFESHCAMARPRRIGTGTYENAKMRGIFSRKCTDVPSARFQCTSTGVIYNSATHASPVWTRSCRGEASGLLNVPKTRPYMVAYVTFCNCLICRMVDVVKSYIRPVSGSRRFPGIAMYYAPTEAWLLLGRGAVNRGGGSVFFDDLGGDGIGGVDEGDEG